MPKKNRIELKGKDNFMRDCFRNYLTSKIHIDTKINWLLGISGLIMSLSIQYVAGEGNYLFVAGTSIIMLSSFFSFVIGLLNLDLPHFMLNSQKHAENNVMFHSHFKGRTVDDVANDFKNIKTEDDVIRQYSTNFYNLVNRNLLFKNRYFNVARNILLCGIILGILIVVISWF